MLSFKTFIIESNDLFDKFNSSNIESVSVGKTLKGKKELTVKLKNDDKTYLISAFKITGYDVKNKIRNVGGTTNEVYINISVRKNNTYLYSTMKSFGKAKGEATESRLKMEKAMEKVNKWSKKTFNVEFNEHDFGY